MSLTGSHFVSISDIPREEVDYILAVAKNFKEVAPDPLLSGKIMASLFYEPSTRTRFSFESAAARLGMQVLASENAREYTSYDKGESMADTVRVLERLCDVIVMRGHEEGMLEEAAAASRVPVISAGDGVGEHPTQTLLDLFTIQERLGSVEGKKIALVGDLKHGRTVRSLARALTKYNGVELVLVSPASLAMRDDVLGDLDAAGVSYRMTENMTEVLPEIDVLYMTRIQKERFGSAEEYEAQKGVYVFGSESLQVFNSKGILMHPLPRVDEIDPVVDSDARAVYFDQVENGLYVRMALLALIMEEGV